MTDRLGGRGAGTLTLLWWLVLGQWRAQPGRWLVAVFAIAIGVSLGLAIELVNRSALSEFDQALSVVNGEAQASIVSRGQGFDESLYAQALAQPSFSAVSPVVELTVSRDGKPLKLIGLDVMRAATVTPALLPQAADQGAVSAVFGDDTIFLSNAAMTLWQVTTGQTIELRNGLSVVSLRVAGTVPGASAGQALAVMDIGAAQWRFGWLGRLSRLDLRLVPGGAAKSAQRDFAARLPAQALWSTPDAGSQRMSSLSRAYRVNLSVLALVALFTGGFIVHATLSLATARQSATLALLGVLGAPAAQARHSVLAQALIVGLLGSLLGVAAGVLLAASLLSIVGADLGGGYFGNLRTSLTAPPGVLLAFVALGTATALAGCLGPARAVRLRAPAQALKHANDTIEPAIRHPAAAAAMLGILGLVLVRLPAWEGLPLAAYGAIACWLFAGILLVGPLTAQVGRFAHASMPGSWRHPSLWLALQRIRGAPQGAAIALSGVVASFALASAMSIMVDSFRHSVADWLDKVLPADLYGRAGTQGTAAALSEAWQKRIAMIPGVARVEFLRSIDLNLRSDRPPVALLIRTVDRADPQRSLPLLSSLPPAPSELPMTWISEAMADLYGLKVGESIDLPLVSGTQGFRVAGVWRDYARQHGALVIQRDDYQRLTADTSASDLAIRLIEGESEDQVIARIREAIPELALVEFRSARDIRALSLTIFDRSFAVTYLLEAIAIVVGLFGVGATYAGQALARARELGMLRHLGVTRTQVIRQFAFESALLIAFGVLWGAILGTLIALVLVHRVNPQSFHWTMDLHWPGALLAASGAALIAMGVLAAILAARSAAGRSPIRSVREDW